MTTTITTEEATPTIAATAEVTSQSGKTMNRQPLLCTMGTNTYLTSMFPRDGLCDYIFYDSIYKEDISTFDPPDELNSDLRIFVEQRKEYSITAFGISFGFKHASFLTSNLSRNKEPNSPFMVSYFWQHSIYHFGVLDTPTNDVAESSVQVALDLLKLVNDLSELQRTKGHSCFMAFAAVVPNTVWASFYVGAFAKTVWPHIFIGLGHYVNGDNTFTDCCIMPPTVVMRPAQAMVVGSFDMLTSNSTPPVWAISVTMKGRWTVAEAEETPNFLSRCVHDPSAESFGNIAQVCNDPDFERVVNDLQLHSTLTYGDNHSRVFSYDDEYAFREKLCRLKAEHTSIEFGIAVFDLEYEDFSNSCSFANSRGAFSRLKLLRLLIDFFSTKFHDQTDFAACSSLTR
ncbi:hypothetical protein HPB49_021552 [Dermacentor silvarum]|uniref:Uncharacterized protein n=1 Tax=Dermacentor silvarum TaxID=543639 RepID=A0ACB8CTB4_DERSI|nr:hypothetical protein HPB49_021552 [Dermacentor silvarum]